MNERAQTYAEKLQKMIQCETVSIKDVVQLEKFEKFHTVLKENFPHVFETCEIHQFEDGSLLFKWAAKQPTDAPMMLMSHQDVVAANANDWTHAPFSGDIDEAGNIWGRGTVDTKGSLFCIFQAVDELIADGWENHGDLYISSSAGEEVLGPGAKQSNDLLTSQGVRLQIVMDEGGMITHEPLSGAKGTFAMIGCLEKGTGNYKFIAHGRGGHASAPGKNTPLPRLGALMDDIEKHPPFTPKMNSVTMEMLRRLGTKTGGLQGFLFRHAKGFSPLLTKLLYKTNPSGAAMVATTIAFTTAKGSDGLNVMPQEAYVTANVRFIPHQGVAETTKILAEKAKKHDLEMQVINSTEPCPVVDVTTEQFRLLEATVKEVFPSIIPCPYAMTGGTDSRFFTPICDNIYRFAPLEVTKQQITSIHGVDENISAETLPGGVDFYKVIVKKCLSGL